MNKKKEITDENKLKEIFSQVDYLSKTDKKIIEKAYYFAKKAHQNIKRKSGEPYFVHLISTAENLIDLKMDAQTIAAGFLHDSIEDGVATEEEILENFGEEIVFLVNGVTKLGKIRFHGMERHNESLRKLFVATSQDIRVLVIKFADRLHNAKTLKYVREDKRERIAKETLEIYAPLAYRLGITSLSKQLEDAVFPYVCPEEYKKTKEFLNQRKKQTLLKLEKFTNHLKKKLAENNIKKFKTEKRVKGIYSLYLKLLKKKWDMTKVYDVAALRIIVTDIKTCYEVLGIIHQNYRPMIGRIKDYIAIEKPNGYQSIHTTVFTGSGNVMEIQIRTEKMHQTALYGAASHDNYKSSVNKNIPVNHKDNYWLSKLFGVFKTKEDKTKKIKNKKHSFTWISDLAESSEKDPTRIKSELQGDYFSHRIFIFTPNGDVIDLPVDSTPIDFAFQVHTDLGLKISGVEINGNFKALDTKLENGDIVKIITKKTAKLNKKWLNFVKTDLAIKKIKQSI